MKNVLIIGSGLSGLSCAIQLAQNGINSTLVSPYPSERAQSVMAAGGINASLGKEDSPEQHAIDTLKSGRNIAGEKAVKDLCLNATDIVKWLEKLGVVFSRDNLMSEIWGMDYIGESRTIDMHIKTLRHKLGNAGSQIKTVIGVGYRLEEDA